MSGEKRCIKCNRVLDEDEYFGKCEYCAREGLEEYDMRQDLTPTDVGIKKGEMLVFGSGSITGRTVSRDPDYQDINNQRGGIALIDSAKTFVMKSDSPALLAAALLSMDFRSVEERVIAIMSNGEDRDGFDPLGVLKLNVADYQKGSIGSYKQQIGRIKRDKPPTPAQREEAKSQRLADMARRAVDTSYNTVKTHNGVTYELLKGEQRGLSIGSFNPGMHVCIIYTKVGKKGYSFNARYLKDESKPYSRENLSPRHVSTRYGVTKLSKYTTLSQARTAARLCYIL